MELININEFLQKENIVLPLRMINRLKEKQYDSELKLYRAIETIALEYTSQLLFPHSYVAFYPQVVQYKASFRMTCQLSGAPIQKGESYYCYWPFIQNLSNSKVYTISKKIKSSLGYIDYFPQTLSEYEDWYYKLKNAYYSHSDVIDFYNMSVECGENALDLIELHKQKRKTT